MTTIEWTHMPGFKGDVWNPTTGCTRVSAGCDNCYAFALHDKRYKVNLDAARSQGFVGPALIDGDGWITTSSRERGDPMPFPKQYDLPFSHVQLLEDRVDAPLHRRTPTCYFVDSMADLFHEDVPLDYIKRIWLTMAAAYQHRFLILTKRPERMAEFLRYPSEWPLPNVWLGTSVEDQRAADERVPHLLRTPAAVWFLSCEPLLGPIDLTHWTPKAWMDVRQFNDARRLDWVIVGGESGPRARPMDLAWARSLRDQCAAAGVSFFCKQLGSNPVEAFAVTNRTGVDVGRPAVKLRESHGRDMAEWPEDLRVRTFPA